MTQALSEICDTFDRHGAALIRGVFSPGDVALLRERCHSKFEELDGRAPGKFVRALSATTIFSMPEIVAAIMHPRIVGTLKAVLESRYTLIPDFHLQRNLFDFTDTSRSVTHGFGLIGSGWHHDAGDEGASHYLFDPAYRMAKCGIFLQDNSIEWGGGIEIAPGAHIPPFRTGNAKLDYVALRIQQNIRIVTGKRRIETKAGDFLVFHALLPHRGNTPQILKDHISEEEKRASCVRIARDHAKLVVYFNASRAACAHTYMQHSLKRAARELDNILTGKSGEAFFSDFAALAFPRDYPAAFVKAVCANGLNVEQLDVTDRELAAAIREKALSSPNTLNAFHPDIREAL